MTSAPIQSSTQSYPKNTVESPAQIKLVSQAKEVYFYATCVVDLFAAQAGLGAVRTLEKLGLHVHVPSEQTCCGQPAYNSGFRAEARRVASKQLSLFPKNIPIVIPSGSCGSMMKNHYAHLFNDPNTPITVQQQAHNVSNRIIEWSDFLIQRLSTQKKNAFPTKTKLPPVNVIFHPSCHALREMRIAGQGRALLNLLPNVQVIDLPHAQECCGFGGLFAVKQPVISTAMTDNKVQEIQAVIKSHNASILVSNDFSCLMQISGRLKHQNIPLRVTHLAEFVAERLFPPAS